ncbi:GGDEF domain-containing protein [Tsukamurella soli]|uniref:GGDEF domain-containing protein n=1 Tax=Tsukamurella soli TaxID=644556 RepID=UPI00361503C4
MQSRPTPDSRIDAGGRAAARRRGLGAAWSALADGAAWRQAGRSEFRFAVRAMTEWPVCLVAVRFVSVGACAGLGVAGVVLLWLPTGPHGVVGRSVLVVLLTVSVIVAALWGICPFPGWRGAVAYAVWGDLTILGVALTLSDPRAQLVTVILLSAVGTFVAGFLGWRAMLLHCGYCAAVILGIDAWALCARSASGWSVYLVSGVAVVVDVLMPAMLQFPVEVARRSIVAVTRLSNRDPLTGLLNRRGLRSAATYIVARHRESGGELAVIVVDLDRLKQVNDEYGHIRGDLVLRETGRALAERMDALAAARTGGDEFVLIVHLPDPADLPAVADRCAGCVFGDDQLQVTASVGAAHAPAVTADLDVLQRLADDSMYAAKRAGGGRRVIAAGR